MADETSSFNDRKLRLLTAVLETHDEWALREWERTAEHLASIERCETTLVGHRPNGSTVMLSDIIRNGLASIAQLEQRSGWTLRQLEQESETW